MVLLASRHYNLVAYFLFLQTPIVARLVQGTLLGCVRSSPVRVESKKACMIIDIFHRQVSRCTTNKRGVETRTVVS